MKKKSENKVIIAMSGGVDSSTVALILKNEGWNVQGIFLDFFHNRKAIKEVRDVSAGIGLPIEIVDASKEFEKKVIGYFLDELKKGNTPNPCVRCNKEIKFRILLEKMLSLKADYVATGHYAQIKRQDIGDNKNDKFALFEAKDKNKDQSYFLYRLDQKQLAKILFPLGNFTKTEVRKMAKRFKLPVYEKEESQDICFIPERGYEKFLKKMLKLKPGIIADMEGKAFGKHEGLPLYTIGQRKGIKIGGTGPYFVINKDFKKNVLAVGSEKDLFSQKMKLKDINWIAAEPKFPSKILVRSRYRSVPFYATIDKDMVGFEKPQRAITPGQSAVFYSKNGEVLGGGIII